MVLLPTAIKPMRKIFCFVIKNGAILAPLVYQPLRVKETLIIDRLLGVSSIRERILNDSRSDEDQQFLLVIPLYRTAEQSTDVG